MLRKSLTMAVLSASLLLGCGLPHDFYSARSPDGKRRIVVRAQYVPPDYVVWFTVSRGWLNHTVYTVSRDTIPLYAEAFWQTKTQVAVLYCDSLGSYEVVGYDFDSASRTNELARQKVQRLMLAQYGSRHIWPGYGDTVDWYCEQHRKS